MYDKFKKRFLRWVSEMDDYRRVSRELDELSSDYCALTFERNELEAECNQLDDQCAMLASALVYSNGLTDLLMEAGGYDIACVGDLVIFDHGIQTSWRTA